MQLSGVSTKISGVTGESVEFGFTTSILGGTKPTELMSIIHVLM